MTRDASTISAFAASAGSCHGCRRSVFCWISAFQSGADCGQGKPEMLDFLCSRQSFCAERGCCAKPPQGERKLSSAVLVALPLRGEGMPAAVNEIDHKA